MAKNDETPETPETAAPSAILLEPPATARARSSSATESVVRSMVDLHRTGWASDGVEYGTKREAGNAAVVYRRALLLELAKLNGGAEPPSKSVRSKSWETAPESGKFVFALRARD